MCQRLMARRQWRQVARVGLVASSFWSQPVLAESALQDGLPGLDAIELPPVLVTARLLPELEQRVPASIAVVDGDRLSDEGRHTLSDLDSRVANLQIGDANGLPTVFMRGVGGGGRQVGFEPRTGFFIDGVFLNAPPLSDALLLDLDHVEVIRGPQGSLFGQNAVSGAVSLVTRAPGERFSMQGGASIEDQGERRVAVAADIPLVAERLLMRASVSVARSEGEIENLAGGANPDAFDEAGGRLKLRWRPTANALIDFSADSSLHSDDFPSGEVRIDQHGQPPPDSGAYTIALNTAQREIVRNDGLAATAHMDLERFSLSSISAWREAERAWVLDLDYSAADGALIDYTDRYRRWSQEFRINSLNADVPLRWLAGVYAYRQIGDSDRYTRALSDIQEFVPDLEPGDTLHVQPDVRTSSYALFGSIGYNLSRCWRLDTGLRFVAMSRRLRYSQLSSDGYESIGFASVDNVHERGHERALLPDAALSWDISPRLSTYLRYARGSKSGGFDADALTGGRTEPATFAEESVDSYELGLKSSALRRRLRTNLALFLANYRDYQVSQFRPVGEIVLPVMSNAGRVRSYGPEAEISAVLGKGFGLRASASWVHAEYVEFRDGGGQGVDYSGHRTEYSPRWTVSTALQYRHFVDLAMISELRTEISYAWRDEFYTQASNAPAFLADQRRLLGARIGLVDASSHITLNLYGENLLDDRYSETLNRGTLGAIFGRYGAPRTIGLQLQYRYD